MNDYGIYWSFGLIVKLVCWLTIERIVSAV